MSDWARSTLQRLLDDVTFDRVTPQGLIDSLRYVAREIDGDVLPHTPAAEDDGERRRLAIGLQRLADEAGRATSIDDFGRETLCLELTRAITAIERLSN